MIFLQSLCFRLVTTHRLCDGSELVVTFHCLLVTWGYLKKLLKCTVQLFINELEPIKELRSVGRSNITNQIYLKQIRGEKIARVVEIVRVTISSARRVETIGTFIMRWSCVRHCYADVVPRNFLNIVNPFLANVPILYPLKTLENQRFYIVFRRYKIATLA